MPTLSNRVIKLEQRPQPQRPHGMTQNELARHLNSMELREVEAFAKTMTDDDLDASISYLKTTMEQNHANT